MRDREYGIIDESEASSVKNTLGSSLLGGGNCKGSCRKADYNFVLGVITAQNALARDRPSRHSDPAAAENLSEVCEKVLSQELN